MLETYVVIAAREGKIINPAAKDNTGGRNSSPLPVASSTVAFVQESHQGRGKYSTLPGYITASREVVEYQDTPFPAIVRLWRAYNGRGASPVLCLQLDEIVLPFSLWHPSDPLPPPLSFSLFLSIFTPPPNLPTFSFLDFGLKRKGRIRPRSICPRKRLVNPRNPPQSSRRYEYIMGRNKFLVVLMHIVLLIDESIIFDGNLFTIFRLRSIKFKSREVGTLFPFKHSSATLRKLQRITTSSVSIEG